VGYIRTSTATRPVILNSASPPAAPLDIIRRRVEIDFHPTPEKRWLPVRKDLEVFTMMFSCVLPVEEKFFIKSVQHYQGRIADAVLKEQAARFVYQEAMHAKEHARLNDIVRDAYPIAKKVEAFGGFMLGLTERAMPKATQLAITCAIEHLTSLVADTALREQEFVSKSAEPAFAQLWLWHAAEEIEHKAVCFDVYQHVVGTGFLAYLNRILTMLIVTLCFFIAVVAGAVMFKLEGKRTHRADQAHKPQSDETQAMLPPSPNVRGQKTYCRSLQSSFRSGFICPTTSAAITPGTTTTASLWKPGNSAIRRSAQSPEPNPIF